jgi:hypothetical protein
VIRPDIVARRIGAERTPVVTVDGFHPDPDGLRAAALRSPFGPARHHYPGVRAELPRDYFARVRPVLDGVLRQVFGSGGKVGLIDASFSIVTTAPDALSVAQRVPHVDAVDAGRIALVHYLALESSDGTAFYRHRATGYERVDAARGDDYRARLGEELQRTPPSPGYISDNSSLFERTALVEGRFNRAVIYPSALLHSGAIAPGAALDPDPARGRLTVTAFLTVA